MPDPTLDTLLEQSIAHHRAGRLREAEAGYRRILQGDPNDPNALNLLGVLAGGAGDARAAAELIGRAVAVRPDDPDLLGNYATALRQAGRHEESVKAYHRAVALKEDPEFLMGLGDSYKQKRMFEQALACYRRAADLRPDRFDSIYAFGSLLLQVHAIEQALPALQRATQVDPKRHEAHRDFAVALHHIQRFEESAEQCRQALAINPNDVVALAHLALSLRRLGRPDEGDVYFERITRLPAKTPQEVFNRALALENLDRYEEAIEEYRETIRLDPSAIPIYLNLGNLLRLCGESDAALEWFDKALKGMPDMPLAHLDRAVVLLLKGDFEEAWKEYDWRWRCPERHAPPRALPQPLWRTQSVAGKTVLLHSEQGFGDTFQFIRYAPLVAARGAKVIAEVNPELVNIVRTMKGINRVIARNIDPLPAFDLHAPLMDLPLIFDTRMETIPAEVPYLRADPAKVEKWASRLAAEEPGGRPRLRVGLVWAGRPTHAYDRARSTRLEHLAPLAKAGDGVSFVSLQQGIAAEQLANPPAGLKVRNHAPDLFDFTDTAALLANLDLLISVDTSVAHLAGALGRPVWVLLPVAPDWRWLERRSDSPWYPTMKLYRQTKRNVWTDVAERVAGDVINL